MKATERGLCGRCFKKDDVNPKLEVREIIYRQQWLSEHTGLLFVFLEPCIQKPTWEQVWAKILPTLPPGWFIENVWPA